MLHHERLIRKKKFTGEERIHRIDSPTSGSISAILDELTFLLCMYEEKFEDGYFVPGWLMDRTIIIELKEKVNAFIRHHHANRVNIDKHEHIRIEHDKLAAEMQQLRADWRYNLTKRPGWRSMLDIDYVLCKDEE